ncbi:MAG: HAD-IIIC family phosphatase, partial [Bradyrhizobium sp.]|nr:HAD-IIIC family phosphatase [Bradyrhizobium sp.]
MSRPSAAVDSPPPHAPRQPTVVVAATFTAEPIGEVIGFWARELGQPIEVGFAPYNQVFQQLLDPASEAAANVGGVNVFAIRIEDWGLTTARRIAEAEHEAAGKAREFAAAVKAAAARFSARTLVCLCPTSRSLLRVPAAAAALHRIETALASALRVAGIRVLTPDEITAAYPMEDYGFPNGAAHGHVPYTETFFAALGTLIVRALRAAIAPPVKVLVLDCDETLWKGVVGEDGPMGVVIDSACRTLQEFARFQRAAGMLLCLCSKNVEADVAAVLDHHPDMLLRRNDFVALRINWDAKSDNLRSLAKELNVGLDSLVLLDDNPLECAEVRTRCPEVLAVQLPRDSATLPTFLRNLWLFDGDARTAEDSRRSEFYQKNAERDELLRQADSLADFLAKLELKVRIFIPEQKHLARVAQLTQRTNQFNTTTIRRQESEIAGLLRSGREECLAVEVSDRFGDYGLVGAAFFVIKDDALVVDSLILSCRALGRGVEQGIVAELGAIAIERGLTELRLPFALTSKNQPAHRFLNSLVAHETETDGRAVYRLEPHAAALLRGTPALPASNTARADLESSAPLPSVPSSSLFRLDGAQAEAIASEYVTADAVRSRIVLSRRRRRPALATGYRAPNDDLEAQLTQLWSESLALDRVGVDDDFFELGGTSLQAAMLANTMQGALNRSVDLMSVFEAPTVSDMARLLDREREPGTPPVRAVVGSGEVREGPLSLAQQRLWFLDQFNPGSVVYNEGRAIRLSGELDVAALAKALDALIARHACLRTTFPVFDGRAVQRVEPSQTCSLPVLELAVGSETSRLDEASQRVGKELARPFDLAAGPLFRAGLFRLAARDHVFWFVFHHIIADGSSVMILLRELAALYNARLAQRPPGLPELSVQYLDFACWQRDAQHDQGFKDHRAYWKDQLARKLPALELPTDRPRPAVLTYRGSRLPLKIPEDVVKSLREVGRRERATLFMTLMAALNVLLLRYTGQEDVIVGFPIANRSRRELEGLIGFFV